MDEAERFHWVAFIDKDEIIACDTRPVIETWDDCRRDF